MSRRLDELLEPSLRASGPPRELLSVGAGFWISFFGGAIGPVLWGAYNAHRRGRLRREGLLWIGVAAVAVAGLLAVIAWSLADPAPRGLPEISRQTARIVQRGWALLLFGLVYLRHRSALKAATMMDAHHPSPWKIGIGMVVLAVGLQIVVVAGFVSLSS